ncbi:MAG: energy-coupling factor ABC transporter ATP-binding protein [Synergistaceae bacterium]|jgi:tungstate transport system ATP-binding protein|nr:energy-coupling factor ABC transporter ATP-binding protein [Synergistaceae bacterium]
MRTGKIIFSLRNLSHSYGNHKTLDIASLDIPEGGVVGLVGPNGSGKSTLLKVLAFLQPRSSGDFLFLGEPVNGRERELRRGVTLLLQEPYLLRRSVYENIAYGLRLRGVSKSETSERVSDSLERVGMSATDFARRPWFRLSGGEAQRVSLAARLALRPKALLLDEPTANVDERSAALIKEAIWREWRDRGTAIVVATHDLVWLYETATRIVGMYAGRVIGDGAANLLQGSWDSAESSRGGGFVTLALRGQKIFADAPRTAPEKKPDCAILDPSVITVHSQEQIPSLCQNVLRGFLTQMSLERSTGEILGIVDCGGLFMRARFSLARAREANLHPGIEVWLSFPASSVKFI